LHREAGVVNGMAPLLEMVLHIIENPEGNVQNEADVWIHLRHSAGIGLSRFGGLQGVIRNGPNEIIVNLQGPQGKGRKENRREEKDFSRGYSANHYHASPLLSGSSP
jgi:hypothetical protein